MTWLSRLFGAKDTPPPPKPTLDREALERRAGLGEPLDLEAQLDLATDDAEAASLLWQLLPLSRGAARVEVVAALGERELTPAEQERLLLVAFHDVPGPAWTAVPVAQACDVPVLLRPLTARGAVDEAGAERLQAAGQLVLGLAEATLAGGPHGDATEVPDALKILTAYADAVVAVGADPQALVALEAALLLVAEVDFDAEDGNGDTDAAQARLETALRQALTAGPRDGGTWAEHLGALLRTATGEPALHALRAARLAQVPVAGVLAERVHEAPDDDAAWGVALQGPLEGVLLETLAALATETLQARQAREAELCSPASQAGCQKCGGGPGAEDDELMVPRALEARVAPVLAAVARQPGQHVDLVEAAIAAPSPTLRLHAVAALGAWPAEAIPARTWSLVETLADDSLPDVRARAAALLKRR